MVDDVTTWTVKDMRSGYVEVCRDVLEHGALTSPRGQLTREVVGASIKLLNPERSLPTGVGRKPNVAIGAAEALQLIGGVSHPSLMTNITRNFVEFLDGGTFHGAYGPRLRPQLANVARRLQEDPDTRQAVVTVWDPLHDTQRGVKDLPCTVMLHFLIRDDHLQLHTTMRSNDVWWGLAYDVFQFTQLQLAMAQVLEVPVGPYFHNATSLHVYERDWHRVQGLHEYVGVQGLPAYEGDHGVVDDILSVGLGRTTSWDDTAERARAILRVDGDADDAVEMWYHDTLRPYFPPEQGRLL